MDASPVALLGPRRNFRVLACSHGGDVALLAGGGGAALWRQQLPAAADGGLAVLPAADGGGGLAAVSCADGRLYFLQVLRCRQDLPSLKVQLPCVTTLSLGEPGRLSYTTRLHDAAKGRLLP